ncbi:MAG: hypothetical protein ABR567_03065 [Myxococcales bacterium]|nr:hypothetical protein [Myxococcales bacterium]
MTTLWTVPPAAMQAFEEAARTRFRDQVKPRLVRLFPERAAELGDEKMSAAIERGIDQAIEYGIVAEPDIASFLELWFEADFEPLRRWPWARPVLESPHVDGAAKVEFVLGMA